MKEDNPNHTINTIAHRIMVGDYFPCGVSMGMFLPLGGFNSLTGSQKEGKISCNQDTSTIQNIG